jgi:hypothetical protein
MSEQAYFGIAKQSALVTPAQSEIGQAWIERVDNWDGTLPFTEKGTTMRRFLVVGEEKDIRAEGVLFDNGNVAVTWQFDDLMETGAIEELEERWGRHGNHIVWIDGPR